jgi:hypothetical protein
MSSGRLLDLVLQCQLPALGRLDVEIVRGGRAFEDFDFAVGVSMLFAKSLNMGLE